MADIDLKAVLFGWLDGYGGAIPKNPNDRIAAFQLLFKDLEENGVPKEEVRDFVRLNERHIVKISYNPNHRDSKKAAIWKDMVEKDLERALSRQYPLKKGQLTEEELKPNTSNIPASQGNESVQATEYVRVGKELDRSIFKGVPRPEIEYDKEMSDLLGYNDE